MCGRTTLVTVSADDLAEAFGLEEVPPLTPRYNIAPTQPMPIVVLAPAGGAAGATPRRELHQVRFGLMPFWDKSGGARHLNARVETIFSKRPFAEAVRKRRCLVVVDGFYEWKRVEGAGRGKNKTPNQPYRIHFSDDQPFALAGVWERWSTKDGEAVESCAIVTGPAKGDVVELHDRQPLVVPKADYEAWLSPEGNPEALLESFVAGSPPWVIDMASRYVNDPRHEGPECLHPENDAAPPETLSLFDTAKKGSG